MEMWGYRLAWAMPICWAWAAAVRSAARTFRPPLEQLRRDAHRHVDGRCRNRPLSETGLQVGGWNAQQRAKLVLALPQTDLELRNLGRGLGERALRLVHVQFTGAAGTEAGANDLQHVALQFHVMPGQRNLLLILAHLDVIRRHVAHQRHEDRVVGLDRIVDLGLGGQHGTAEFSPEIQLPGQVESKIKLVVELGKAGDSLIGRRGRADIAASGLLRLREQLALGDCKRIAGLQDPRAVFLEVDVLVIGMGFQIVEHGVVEDAPPAAQVVGMTADADIAGINPLGRDGGPGRSVVRPYLEAVVNIVGKAGASAQAEQSGGEAKEGRRWKGMPHGHTLRGKSVPAVKRTITGSAITIDKTGQSGTLE